MKRNRLLLLMIIALFALPVYVKADFEIKAAGFCNKENDADVYMDEGGQICYVRGGNGYDDPNRNIVLIKDTAGATHFCLGKDDELGTSIYQTNGVNYTNTGYACAVYDAINNNEFTVQQFKSNLTSAVIGGDHKVYSVGNPAATNKIIKNVAAGSAVDIYSKIQFRMWASSITSASCTPDANNAKLQISKGTAPTVTVAATPLKQDAATDTYYYSKVDITVSSADSYKVSLTGAPANTILSTSKTGSPVFDTNTALSGNKTLYLLVPATAVTDSISINVKATATYVKAERLASVYVQEEVPTTLSTNQRVSSLGAKFVDVTGTVEKTANVRIDNNKIDFKVCKKDSKNADKKMAGVKFTITSEDKSTTFELITEEDGCVTRPNVPKLKYTIHEVATPDGYKKGTDGTKDCTTTATGAVCEYTVNNTPIQLKVKKIDKSEQPLKDAKMRILDKDGKVFDEWTTVLADHEVNKNIPFGKYTLMEEEAPDGYVISTSVEFEIKEDGYVLGGKTYPYDKDAIVTLTMVDDFTRVSILKIDAATKQPLVGAKLRIEKEDGTKVGEEWVTDGNPKTFEKMAFGTYYLVEVEAPAGYVLQTERTPFTISQTSKDQEVIIENHEVPSTAANKSALLISFAMLDIALGIAIILYVRKRKATE